MALQTSGPISLLQIATEFGGYTSGPINLGDYYRDASSGGPVSSGSLAASDTNGLSPGTATATCLLKANGQAVTVDENGTVVQGNWYTPTTTNIITNYWFRTTITSGTGSSTGWVQGTAGTDISITNTITTSGPFATRSGSSVGYFDISLTNGGAIIGTWNFNCQTFLSSSA